MQSKINKIDETQVFLIFMLQPLTKSIQQNKVSSTEIAMIMCVMVGMTK